MFACAALATQSALTVPLGLLVAVALGSYTPELFFPASLIVVGAHYLVFISLYGRKAYAVIAGALVLLGTITIFFVSALGLFSGWIGAACLPSSSRFCIARVASPKSHRPKFPGDLNVRASLKIDASTTETLAALSGVPLA
jgi:hypothetical protein